MIAETDILYDENVRKGRSRLYRNKGAAATHNSPDLYLEGRMTDNCRLAFRSILRK